MPRTDMPLAQLYQYRGTNPIPADFDAFWDRQTLRADRFPLTYRICESEIGDFEAVTCRDLYFTGIGGNEVYAKYNRGTPAQGHILPGAVGPAEDMCYVAAFLDDYLLARKGEKLPGIDPKRIYCNGASQGAAFSVAVCALNHNIRKAALLYPFLSDL